MDHEMDEGDLFALNEEAPQIVGMIDERAPDVLMRQEYMESGKWKKLGATHEVKDKKQKKRIYTAEESQPRETDMAPPRERRSSSDESPPRRHNGRVSRSPVRRDSDESPPRRSRKSAERQRSKDSSPPRRQRKNSTDTSPPRKHQGSPEASRRRRDSDASPPRKSRRSPEVRPRSPPRNSRKQSRSPPRQKQQRRSRWSPEAKHDPEIKREPGSPPTSSRMTRTLDGKVSGLQDAKTLKRENDAFKERQEKQFREMKPDISGRDAEVVIRDRRGRNKDFELEVESERVKAVAEEARKKEYDRWGKGLKQIEDLEKRFEEHMHEASKPFARSADDEDLRDHLRNQERLDDPMLEYMRKKKQEENRKKGVEVKPKYLGQFPDNRYNIAPGYRWDGVDRSNGYEKKYFSMVNSKKSMEEEAYRYSTEDM